MKMADRLYNAVARSLLEDEEDNDQSNGVDENSDNITEDDVDSRESPLSFELTERITIAMQSTEIKEENLDMFLSSNRQRSGPPPVTVNSKALSASFSTRNRMVNLKTFEVVQDIGLVGKISADSSSVLSTSVIEDTYKSSEDSEKSVASTIELCSEEVADISAQRGRTASSGGDMPRTFRSAYAAVHGGNEARVTNWSSDFKE